MDKQELAKRLMATYLEELHDLVEAMNRDLLALESESASDQQQGLLKELFRSAHSLKGASRAVNVDLLERSCHGMEDILAYARERKCTLAPDVISIFFRVVDGVQAAGLLLRDEESLDDSPLHDLIEELNAAAAKTRSQAGAGSKANAATPGASTPLEPSATSSPSVEAIASTDPVLVGSSVLDNGGREQKRSMGDPKSDGAAKSDGGDGQSARNPRRANRSTAVVRVAAEKLDALLAQNGELLVARRRVEQRSTDAELLIDAIVALRSDWAQLAKPVRQLAEAQELEGNATIRNSGVKVRELLKAGSDQLAQLERQAERLTSNMTADARALMQTCNALDDEVYRVRMLPFVEACSGLKRVVRDVAQSTGKSVELVVEGDDVEVDRSVLEGLKSPLLHLVRNAVDHGIESPSVRESLGKTLQGKVTVSAALRGGHIEVVVSDDGRGFELQRIRDQAIERGIPVPPDESDQAKLVFLPGFSTAPEVTDVSGRGVGLDVVASAVQELHGGVEVDFVTGRGCRFTITAPLTLTTVRSVLVKSGGHTYAIPTSTVQQLVRFKEDRVALLSGREVLTLGEVPVPVVALAEVLGFSSPPINPDGNRLAIVVGNSEECAAFVVDELCAEQEVLVKNLGARIRRMRHVSGATLLPSGQVALVLNPTAVVDTALGRAVGTTTSIIQAPQRTQRTRRLLVVDDSMTTRALMKGILETAGFDVTAAVDGEQAWGKLAQDTFDLVVSDVDMPRMNGFELTENIRKNWPELPVILVTARATEEDRTQGVRVGANAYFVKSGFDQITFLDLIDQLT